MAELVLALDVPTRERALEVVDRCAGLRWVKVGPVLFTTAGPSLIETLKARGLRVFLDLKWHDIPNTVSGGVTRARSLGVDLVTVHALGGSAMLGAAKAAAGPDLAVVAVTVLTSHDANAFAEVMGRPIELAQEALRFARMAAAAGLDGVVSAPLETAAIRAALGRGPLIVNPGIRAATDQKGDQTRVATIGTAVAAGATHLVVGRPVLEAPDPATAWAALHAELTRCSLPS